MHWVVLEMVFLLRKRLPEFSQRKSYNYKGYRVFSRPCVTVSYKMGLKVKPNARLGTYHVLF